MTRFLATGDLHLGAGSDLGREPGERLREQREVWERIVALANELDAFLLFAGDAWERRRPSPEELIAFLEPIHGARTGPLVIAGNHDVEAFEKPTGYDVRGRFHMTRPQVVPIGDETSVACLPWAPPGRLVAAEGGGDRDEINRRLAAGLLDIARGLFAEMAPGRSRLLLAHWAVGGAVTPTGAPVDLFREPVLPLDELEAIGFDAVILGHIHKPQLLSSGDRPVFYVGSPMPLNFGEAASEHVVWLLDVEAGRPASVFQIPIESRRLVPIEINLHVMRSLDPLSPERWLDLGGAIGGAIVKVKLRASQEQARRIDVAAFKQTLLNAGAHKVWSVQVDVQRDEVAAGASLDEHVDDETALARWLELHGHEQTDELVSLHRRFAEAVA